MIVEKAVSLQLKDVRERRRRSTKGKSEFQSQSATRRAKKKIRSTRGHSEERSQFATKRGKRQTQRANQSKVRITQSACY